MGPVVEVKGVGLRAHYLLWAIERVTLHGIRQGRLMMHVSDFEPCPPNLSDDHYAGNIYETFSAAVGTFSDGYPIRRLRRAAYNQQRQQYPCAHSLAP